MNIIYLHFYYNTIKALHVIMMVTWFAGLFYLPRLFVYHAMTKDTNTANTFKIMERRLLIMMHIGGIGTAVFGIWLLQIYHFSYLKLAWIHVKLLLVFFLIVHHIVCMAYVKQFARDNCHKSHVYFRYFNEIPSILLILIILLAVLKPALKFFS